MLKKANEGSLFFGDEEVFCDKKLSYQSFVEIIHDFVSEVGYLGMKGQNTRLSIRVPHGIM
jgi:hypothetical protein